MAFFCHQAARTPGSGAGRRRGRRSVLHGSGSFVGLRAHGRGPSLQITWLYPNVIDEAAVRSSSGERLALGDAGTPPAAFTIAVRAASLGGQPRAGPGDVVSRPASPATRVARVATPAALTLDPRARTRLAPCGPGAGGRMLRADDAGVAHDRRHASRQSGHRRRGGWSTSRSWIPGPVLAMVSR